MLITGEEEEEKKKKEKLNKLKVKGNKKIEK